MRVRGGYESAIADAGQPRKWTEREVLDALHQRLCRLDRGMTSRRYVIAEHVRLSPLAARRILDLVAMDTWSSSGYALDGFEVKVSRSDLRRELAQPGKAAAFEEHLDTFSIVAPVAVLSGWREMLFPPQWGVMTVADDGTTRWIRKPAGRVGFEGVSRPMDRALTAGLMRAAVNTAQHECSRHGDLGGSRPAVAP